MGGGNSLDRYSRTAEIMADAAYVMLCKDAKTYTGNFAVDSKVLSDEGVTDFSKYAVDPSEWLFNLMYFSIVFIVFTLIYINFL